MRRLAFVTAAFVAGVMVSAASVGTATAKPAPPGPGNSAAAKACQNDGWQNLVASDGATFASQDECVAYAAHGGVLAAKPPTSTGSLHLAFSNCSPYTDPTLDTCSATLSGAGAQPGSDITWCGSAVGCGPLGLPVNDEGNIGYFIASLRCVAGSTYYITAPSATGGTLQSDPATCPVLG
jgi:hypothetical protein